VTADAAAQHVERGQQHQREHEQDDGDRGGGARAVALDFSAMEYMNSGGIGLLVTLLVRAQRSGVRLLAIGLSDHYRQILALTRLDEAIEILPDEAAAMAAVDA